MSKKKFTVYGNCQAHALAIKLIEVEEFFKYFNYVPLAPLHEIESVERAKSVLSQCDLILYQHVSEQYYDVNLSTRNILSDLRNSIQLISFPSLHFSAYFPHLGRFPNVRSILDWVHDYNILYAYIIGLTEAEVFSFITSPDFYSSRQSLLSLEESIQNLREREQRNNVDVRISGYLSEVYKSRKMFHVHNHPCGKLLEYIASEVIKKIEIRRNTAQLYGVSRHEPLCNIVCPVYRSTHRNLRLEFDDDFLSYRSKSKKLNMKEVIEGFFSTYRNLDRSFLLEQVQLKRPSTITVFESFSERVGV